MSGETEDQIDKNRVERSEESQTSYYPISVPVGQGKTDYEKYLKTETLLSLQKPLDEAVSSQEMLFQVTHQASELWMKEMIQNLDFTLKALDINNPETYCIQSAIWRLEIIHRIQHLLIYHVDLLSQSLSIYEYGKIREALGQGSGMESPGFNWLLDYPPTLWKAFQKVLDKEGVDVRMIYVDYKQHMPLHQLAEAYMTFDDLFHKWRTHHMDMVMRTIGIDSNSLKGIPSKVLQRGVLERFFPELLDIRNQLTNESQLSYGGSPLET